MGFVSEETGIVVSAGNLRPKGNGEYRTRITRVFAEIDVIVGAVKGDRVPYLPGCDGGSANARSVVVFASRISKGGTDQVLEVPGSVVAVGPGRTIGHVGGSGGLSGITPSRGDHGIRAGNASGAHPNPGSARGIPSLNFVRQFLSVRRVEAKVASRGRSEGVIGESGDARIQFDQNRKLSQGGRTRIAGQSQWQTEGIGIRIGNLESVGLGCGAVRSGGIGAGCGDGEGAGADFIGCSADLSG